MNETAVQEEIMIESGLESLDERLLDPGSSELRFKQKIPSKGYRSAYRVINGCQLQIAVRTLRTQKRFDFNLAYLDPNPIEKRHISWFWFYAMMLFITVLAASVALILGNLFPGGERLGLWVTIHAAVLAVISFLMLLNRSYRREVFVSRFGRTPILELAPHLPSRKEYQTFILELTDRALTAQGKANEMQKTALAGELREHRRLRDEGILDDATYDEAKSKLMKSF